MFSLEQQELVRRRVLELAHADPEIVGAAITGSFARGAADRWSDVDLFFGYGPGSTASAVLDSWTERLDGHFGVAHYFDVHGHGAVYRAFLLTDVVEVDIGVADESHFRAVPGKAFRVVFRRTAPTGPRAADPPRAADSEPDRTSVGHAWHHLIHARVGLERDDPTTTRRWTDAARDVLTQLTGRRPDLSTGADPSGDLDVLTAAYLDGLELRVDAGHPLVHAVTRVRDFPWSQASDGS